MDDRKSLAARTARALRQNTDSPTPDPEAPEVDAVDADAPETGTVEPESDEAQPDDAEPDDAEPAETEPEAVAEPEAPRAGGRRILIATVATAVTTTLALAFAIVAAVLWWRGGGTSDVASSRDAVLRAARQDVVILNTGDFHNAAAVTKQWQSVTTGKLAGEISASADAVTKTIAEGKLVTSAVIRDAAVTAIDVHKGSATVILSVVITRKPISGDAQSIRSRLQATMTRVGEDWKLSDLTPVAVLSS